MAVRRVRNLPSLRHLFSTVDARRLNLVKCYSAKFTCPGHTPEFYEDAVALCPRMKKGTWTSSGPFTTNTPDSVFPYCGDSRFLTTAYILFGFDCLREYVAFAKYSYLF